MKTRAPADVEYRVRFEHVGGFLIQDREGDPTIWGAIMKNPSESAYLKAILAADAREKGVKVLSYEITKTGVIAKVDWL